MRDPKQNAILSHRKHKSLKDFYQDFSLTLQAIEPAICTQQFMHPITIYRPSVSLIFTI